jgi:biotin transporter BioY
MWGTPTAGIIVLVCAGIIWLGLAFAVGRYAERKGLNDFAFMLIAVLFSPLLALLIAAGCTSRVHTQDTNSPSHPQQ